MTPPWALTIVPQHPVAGSLATVVLSRLKGPANQMVLRIEWGDESRPREWLRRYCERLDIPHLYRAAGEYQLQAEVSEDIEDTPLRIKRTVVVGVAA